MQQGKQKKMKIPCPGYRDLCMLVLETNIYIYIYIYISRLYIYITNERKIIKVIKKSDII